MNLPVKLTISELVDRGRELTEKMNEIDASELQLSVAKNAHKALAEKLDIVVRELRRSIHTRQEYREVQIERVKDYEGRVERTTRLDTGEVISERPLDPSEMQQVFQIVEPHTPKTSPKRRKDAEANT